MPEGYDHTLVHGNYKLDNVMYAPGTPPEINAVLDWEMGTLGDPSADIGWMLCYWDTDPLVEDLMPTFLDRSGYPTKEELIERYEEQSGLEFMNRRFYVALGLYMLLGVFEMFYARYLNGNSNDNLYPKMGNSFPRSADRRKGSSRVNGTSESTRTAVCSSRTDDTVHFARVRPERSPELAAGVSSASYSIEIAVWTSDIELLSVCSQIDLWGSQQATTASSDRLA